MMIAITIIAIIVIIVIAIAVIINFKRFLGVKHAGLTLDATGQSITSPIGFGHHEEEDVDDACEGDDENRFFYCISSIKALGGCPPN